MGVKAKICGLSTEEALAAVAGRPQTGSHVGFVFFPPSPRNIGFEQAKGFIRRMPPHLGTVGVLVDPDDEMLNAALATGIQTVQLHKTAPERAAAIRAHIPVWAAIAVKTRADVEQAAAYKGAADRILYDAKTPDDAALPGGMGVRFDWKLLENIAHPLPWALSGGLDADNVREAVGITGAKLVDVSSGVESAPGVKDVAKIIAFLKAVAQC